ncbi:hypothetical protein RHSIM_Rhsim07G0170700 [Rhododendron simsii]|uniref:Protein FAR1-RELATED SEQUENCE n=1 Tax=Rhododendron simsii TaxID=118357 RepID=A0A834LGI3_RHOSS|nr:hypothetical protein RHSIM_Rhsim07G0170700 [Rhododendron simsii]
MKSEGQSNTSNLIVKLPILPVKLNFNYHIATEMKNPTLSDYDTIAGALSVYCLTGMSSPEGTGSKRSVKGVRVKNLEMDTMRLGFGCDVTVVACPPAIPDCEKSSNIDHTLQLAIVVLGWDQNTARQICYLFIVRMEDQVSLEWVHEQLLKGCTLSIGMEFESEDSAYRLYSEYGRIVGFSVRKDYSIKSKKDDVSPNRASLKWHVKRFDVTHNHLLHIPETVHMMRNQRGLSESQGINAKIVKAIGFPLKFSRDLMSAQSEGRNSLGSCKRILNGTCILKEGGIYNMVKQDFC